MRTFAIAAAALALTGCFGGGSDPPGWDGKGALPEERGTATAYAVRKLTVADPAPAAARLLGVPADEVRVTDTDGTITAQRPAAGGTAPDEATALEKAREVLTAYGMDPGEWATIDLQIGSVRTVLFEVTKEVPVFPFKGVVKPAVLVRVDSRGVHQFTLTPVRLTPSSVPIISAEEAFGRLKPGSYVAVRRVLAADSTGGLRPYWEFETKDREKRPVLAVLTP